MCFLICLTLLMQAGHRGPRLRGLLRERSWCGPLTCCFTAGNAVPSAGELAVFCRPVVSAPTLVRRDGSVAADGWLPDVAVAAPDDDGHPVTIECGQGVLQPDAELAHDLVRMGQLLLVLVLGQVLAAKPAAPVADVPAPTVQCIRHRAG